MRYRDFGASTLHSFLGDRVLCRNLEPFDRSLPSFSELSASLGISGQHPPRKAEPGYGAVVAKLLKKMRGPGRTLKNIFYVGDTFLSDGSAFGSILSATGWNGLLFIGCDEGGTPPWLERRGNVVVSNRWSALGGIVRELERNGIIPGEETAVVVDIDKTALAAKGRNDLALEAARLDAIGEIANAANGEVDGKAFAIAYGEFERPEYHRFTGDNQDHLVYLCLMISAGAFPTDEVRKGVEKGALEFSEVLLQVECKRDRLSADGLRPIHDDFISRFKDGDPTPFPAFRELEYRFTAGRLGGGEFSEELLSSRIVITREVKEAALSLSADGALVVGISDKPDRAFFPGKDAGNSGLLPLHRMETIIVGEEAGDTRHDFDR